MTGEIATHGVAIMSQRKGLEFETTIKSDTNNLNHLVKKLLDTFGESIHFLRDPTRGGVATVMNELVGQSKLGIDLIQKKIPIDQQVEGACEMLGLDPMYVANEGIFIVIVDDSVLEQVLEILHNDDSGKSAAHIGEVVSNHPGQVVMTSRIGGKRVVNYLIGEQLPRIC